MHDSMPPVGGKTARWLCCNEQLDATTNIRGWTCGIPRVSELNILTVCKHELGERCEGAKLGLEFCPKHLQRFTAAFRELLIIDVEQAIDIGP